ncbi:hypothetical protein [Psychromicrobium xiongbiense]|uniref:hypothetical protein n=1 Tax=Psychromicrobium xiongbiense TaxID=3051184 RepID=UPI0025547EB8|nr:hypothetical protein [Psychromicrobium sp. YIM S02556]
MSDAERLIKSNQEQAVAAWVNYLNQLRLDGLLYALRLQDVNLRDALAAVDDALRTIKVDIVDRNRGHLRGMHGFIAEVAEVGVGNARRLILGEETGYQWVNNNRAEDLLRDGVAIQQKFYAAQGSFGLDAVLEHLQRYPDFLENGGRYQIPRDHFEIIQKLRAMPLEEAGKHLSRSGDGPSFTDWQRVQAFFDTGPVDIESVEPSHFEYRDVQRGAYEARLEAEKDSLRSTGQSAKDGAYQVSRPTLREGAQATLAAAAIEGGTTFVLAVVAKRREGKKLKDFTGEDWIDIAGDAGFGVVKGGVRGVTIYALTNFTVTSAAAASAVVTAAFGIAEQANRLRRGEIDEVEFIENSELVALEVAVSALSSFVGQAFIPIPVLGAVIGNTVGMVMYRAAASSLSKREAALLEQYLREQRELDAELSAEYQELIDQLDEAMAGYLGLLELAFSPDVQVAFASSTELANELGVAPNEILDSEEEIIEYFAH